MSVPNTVEELVQLIRKSGMIEDGRFNSYLQQRQMGRGLPPDPRDACDAMVADGILTNFQSEQFMLGKWRGFTLGKYKLLERVGVGGMGQVFLCEHMFMKKRVAVKVLPPAKADQPAALGRFYREARAAGSIQHPNIVRTHDIDQDGNLHFIVMEYVDGSNLLDVVKKFGKMDVTRAISYIRQVAIGLDHAFRNGIIHRDIKPGNILIDRRGKARILDMGLARFFNDQNDNLTVKYDDKIVLGTADYVAPEQVANSHSVDTRADIYALGATFYFLVAGHPPFPTGTVSQKLLWHRTKDPTPIKQVRPELSDELAAVITKMMAKDPKNRYQTPAEVAAVLERFLPAGVPLPALEEMPVLSRAAAEGMIEEVAEETEPMTLQATPEPALAGVVAAGSGSFGASASGSSSVVDLRQAPTIRPAASGNPFAMTAGPSAQNPFGARDSGSAWNDLPNGHAGRGFGEPRGSSPFGSSAGGNPFMGGSPDPTPHHNRNVKATTIFMPPPEKDATSQFKAKQLIMYVMLGASVIVALGLVAWKFILK